MAHLALYRRFRPLIFGDVTGQENIVSTIKNQIINKSFGHAYIFSGIRGTGKTTIAKIFARSINCESPIDSEPCNECETCKQILLNTSMDIIEIDAASNNGVDDIREIRENVKFPPSNSKYKVYIIDEVHMLSKGAFNALLKTLEEPPEYVVFLLATTEPNKIPDTILSRCQRYDLNRVSNEDIISRIQYILNELDVKAEKEALDLIVSKAGGSVRDSLSILEKCISQSDDLSLNSVINSLGLVDSETLNELSKSIISNNINIALNIVDQAFVNGKDIDQFLTMIIKYYRDLMIIKMHESSFKILDITEEKFDILKDIVKDIELNKITRILNIFIELENKMKWSTHKKIMLEMAIVKMFNVKSDSSVEALLERIRNLEDKIDRISIEGVKVSPQKENIKKQVKIIEEKHETADSIEKFIGESAKFEIELSEVLGKWNELLKILKKVRIKVYAFLIEGEPVSISGNTIMLKYNKEYKFHGDNLLKQKNKETVDNVLKQVFLKDLTIDVTYENIVKKSEININVDNSEQINEYFSEYRNVLEIKE